MFHNFKKPGGTLGSFNKVINQIMSRGNEVWLRVKAMPTNTKGGQSEWRISDYDVHNLLEEVLLELRIANLHMAAITDEQILDGDV